MSCTLPNLLNGSGTTISFFIVLSAFFIHIFKHQQFTHGRSQGRAYLTPPLHTPTAKLAVRIVQVEHRPRRARHISPGRRLRNHQLELVHIQSHQRHNTSAPPLGVHQIAAAGLIIITLDARCNTRIVHVEKYSPLHPILSPFVVGRSSGSRSRKRRCPSRSPCPCRGHPLSA